MMPRLAALSIAEINARICSELGDCAERAVFCIVRRRVTTVRLRSDRFTVWRARLAADFVFAIVIKNLRACTLANVWRLSTLKVFELRPTRRRAKWHVRAMPERYNRLFNSSFAFRRWAASAPPIRIWSTESVPLEAGVEIVPS
jgi:hypothetical protein